MSLSLCQDESHFFLLLIHFCPSVLKFVFVSLNFLFFLTFQILSVASIHLTITSFPSGAEMNENFNSLQFDISFFQSFLIRLLPSDESSFFFFSFYFARQRWASEQLTICRNSSSISLYLQDPSCSFSAPSRGIESPFMSSLLADGLTQVLY